jgi:hypothetical protein
LTVYPSTTVATNVSASYPLPPNIRIGVTHGNSDSITYSVSAFLIR